MAFKTERLVCPACGFPVEVGMKECPAGHPLNITTFNSVYSMPLPMVNKYAGTYKKELAEDPDDQDLNTAIAFCYLKLKLYDKALPAFEKAMEDNFDNSETFFYAAICLLQGKKAFVNPRTVIDKAEEYINAALMIEPKGIYYYLWAYLRYDHHYRKAYNMNPNYATLLVQAKETGLSEADIEQLYGVLGVERPSCL